MAVTLFTVACGYVGARAVPELMLNNEWRENLETLQVLTKTSNAVYCLSHDQTRLDNDCCAYCSIMTPSLALEVELRCYVLQ